MTTTAAGIDEPAGGPAPTTFRRIAVVNRGESAMRLIHAVRDLNAQHGTSIEVVALHTDGERRAMFVREADLAVSLGPASARPYLDHAVLERALRECGADAAWVGWGFVAEDPTFAELCARIGVTFIGPSPEAMRQLGDKIGSKLIAEEVGVPVAPWSRGAVDTLDDALAQSARIGYPLMLKATAGGGGRGIRVITSDDDLRDAYTRTREEAQRSFGSGVVFLEKLVTGARHVEVQVISDGQNAWALGVRDCTVQRRNQKVIEESASPVLSPEQVAELKASAERLAVRVAYAGAGTVEFLYHPQDRFFAFLEVNTRLQVEHPITEVTTDVDLVKLQIHVAGGGRLVGPAPAEKGHAVEARLNAEDPDRDFAPSPGRIALLTLPSGPGIRVDTGVGEGDVIPADFDSMIAKIIAYGRDRDEALGRLRRAMAETTVVIEGGSTNKSFVIDLLEQPEVVDGSCDTGWIDRVRGEGRLVSSAHSGVALVVAGIEAYEEQEQVEVARLLETASGGRPQVQHRGGRTVELKLRGSSYKVRVDRLGPLRFRVGVDDLTPVDADLDRIDDHTARLTLEGQRYRLVTATHGPVHLVEVNGTTHRVSRDEGGVLRSPAPALVVATPVAVGATVTAGQPVLVLESMKMETVLPAPYAATVRELHVSAGSQVETGTPLIRLEPIADGPQETAAPVSAVDLDLPLPAPDGTADERAREGLTELSGMLLGYDVDPTAEGHALRGYLGARDELAADGRAPIGDELELLRVFADFAELSRNRPMATERAPQSTVHSPREFFHTYLRTLDPDRGGLTEEFRSKLRRVLEHYRVDSFDRTRELDDAVFRIFLAQRRSTPDVTVATALLQRWTTEPRPAAPLDGVVRDTLDRLVLATQLRFPIVGDLARSVRFRWFDQPLVDAERASVLAHVQTEVADLADHPDAPDRAARIEALAAIPEQVVQFLGERLQGELPGTEPMLEVLVRRHYREYALDGVRSLAVDGRPFAVADYVLDERPTHLVSTIGTVDELSPDSPLVAAIDHQVGLATTDHEVVVDLYLSWPGLPEKPDEASGALRDRLASLGFTQRARRVALAVAPGGARDVAYFTFRPDHDATFATSGPAPGGLFEDDLVRGVHPMVGRRLNLWRLRHFDLTRVDGPEDVLLLHATAKDNPADQRLVAMAQVRQFSVVRDDGGRITSIPHVERAIAGCLEAIRRARAARGAAGARLDTNLVWLHVWPVIEADVEQIAALRDKIAPLTAGAGIEEILADGRVPGPDGTTVPISARFFYSPGSGVTSTIGEPPAELLAPVDDYQQKVLRARRRGLVYPYEVQEMVAGPGGSSQEYDLDDAGRLVPVDRAPGLNTAGIVAGVVTTRTRLHPEGVTRVTIAGDPTMALGAVSEPECSRVVAAIDLAQQMGVPLEWYALSAGARISMDSGVENMDAVARALKRIIEFTQDGGEINIVVAGINVGAQPYWNAEATMLMHTKGILVMTPDSAMVLTGKQSLDFSGGVSAEDNFGIGGYDRVMGPNGQAQYWAPDLSGAVGILLEHYDHSYVLPGETGPRRAATSDPTDRDVSPYPHVLEGSDFTTVGDIFSPATNPDRKKAFDIRTLMRAVSDQDHRVLERWAGMADAETAVVQDVHLGGHPVTLIGIESKSVPRRGVPPTDGPDTYTSGTLFPRSSKKVARAINAASGNRPVVVLANLSGFDGSPESMRALQLEYGAEIGRSIVNFDGPIVFTVVSRYHGGAFVVFSKALNPSMTVLAVDGSFASVLGGAPAAAVVFTADVDARTAADPRVSAAEQSLAQASEDERAARRVALTDIRTAVRAEKLGEVAAQFDGIHSIRRAVRVGAVDKVVDAAALRPEIIAALDARLP
ncbi:carboxyl transferase domain-containing protein [Dermatophilaceae bacterium Soc4.6]